MSSLSGAHASAPAEASPRSTSGPRSDRQPPRARRRTALGALVGLSATALSSLPMAALPAHAAAETIRVTAASSAVVDTAGNRWESATGFAGGGGFWTATPPGGDIKGTADDALYRTERWGLNGWSRAVPNGTYQVTLKLRESWFDGPGQRIFSVAAEGTPVITDLDVFAVAGKDTAYDRSFPVTVRDGRLDLSFSARVDDPMVSAIQVSPTGGIAPVETPADSGAVAASATSSGSSATLTWSTGASPAKGWYVGRDGSDASGFGAWSTMLAGSARSQTFTNLVTGRTYQLFVVNADTEERTVVSVTVGSPAPTPTPTPAPGAIDGVTATATGTSATLSWTAPADPNRGWYVARDGSDASGFGAWSTMVAGGARSQTFTNLVPGRTYTLSVTNVDTEAKVSRSVSIPGSTTTPAPTPTPEPTPTPAPTPPPVQAPPGAPSWPLGISGSRTHLVDAKGAPFFLVGDTSWSLIHGLPVAEAKKYIDARKAQGYNTILTNAVFRDRTMGTPRGLPFAGGDLRRPNEAYWSGMDQIVAYAASQGMTLYVGMIWFADAGGWNAGAMPSDDEFRTYGAWLGARYRNASNLIWFAGGDDSNAKWPPKADILVGAFESTNPHAVISYHNQYKAPEMQWRSWNDFYSFQFNSNSYPYPYTIAREVSGYSPRRPVLDMEPAYDPYPCCSPDNPTTEPQENRRYGWWTTLSGTLGVVYGGDRPTWDVGFSSGWVAPYGSINRTAALETATIGKIVTRYAWQSLIPDWSGTVLGDRRYGTDQFVAAARSGDGRLIMAYTPVRRAVTVDLSRLAGPGTAIWVEPATGRQVGAAMAVGNTGQRTFDSPLGQDGLLILTAN